MQVTEAIRDLWELGGEMTDLDPWYLTADPQTGNPATDFDPNSRGVQYYLEQLSRAQVAISNWRKAQGAEVRFKRFIETRNINVGLRDNGFAFRQYGAYGVSVPVSEFIDGFPIGMADIFENSAILIDGTTYAVIKSYYDNTVEGGSIIFLFFDNISLFTEEDITTSPAVTNGGGARHIVSLETDVIGQDGVLVVDDKDSTNAGDFLRIQNIGTVYSTTLTMTGFDGTVLAPGDIRNFQWAGSTWATYTGSVSSDGNLYMTWFPIDTSGTIYSDGFVASLPTETIEILKLYDGPAGNRLFRPKNKESLYIQPPVAGTPTQWYVIGDRLYFDTFFDTNRFYKMEYYRVPSQLTATTNAELNALSFEIPPYFHEPLILWCEWRQARRSQEFDKAYAIKQDLVQVIERLSTEFSLDFMRDETYGFFAQYEESDS